MKSHQIEKLRNQIALQQLKLFPPVIVKTSPHIIVIGKSNDNPDGNIVPPNTPVMKTRSVKK